MQTVDRAQDLAERAAALIPGGVNSVNRVMPWPFVITGAEGAWLHDAEDPEKRSRLLAELGYWRLALTATDADAGPGLLPALAAPVARTADDIERLRNADGGFDLEAALVHADGVSELYLGQIKGPRIDIATDAVVRPAGAKAYAAATRMYGLVEGHLLWAWDIAALGFELGAHASARLARAE